jgi:hypothetical protein
MYEKRQTHLESVAPKVALLSHIGAEGGGVRGSRSGKSLFVLECIAGDGQVAAVHVVDNQCSLGHRCHGEVINVAKGLWDVRKRDKQAAKESATEPALS